MTGKKGRSGGARPGTGRPRTRITIYPPPGIIEQLEEIAEAEGANVADVVQSLLLNGISEWQAAHKALTIDATSNTD